MSNSDDVDVSRTIAVGSSATWVTAVEIIALHDVAAAPMVLIGALTVIDN